MPSAYETLISISSLRKAWIKIKQKSRAAGVDGITVADFDKDVNRQLQSLSDQLRVHKYKPQPYLIFEVPKKNKDEVRRLSMLSVRDKIVQEAIKTFLEPRCEKIFLGSSYAYRSQKGTYRAIKRTFSECQNKKYSYVLRLDIDDFFDTIDIAILQSRVSTIANCQELTNLIMLIVKMGCISGNMKWEDTTKGIPQGAVLSPLLSNLYLHSFDQFMRSMEIPYIRYADDFLVLTENKERADYVKEVIEKHLKNRLHLSLNEPLILKIDEGFEFLGVTVSRKAITISDKKRCELNERLASINLYPDGFTNKDIKTLDGMQNYYAKLLPQTDLEKFDERLRQSLFESIQKRYNEFPTKKYLANLLCSIPYFSERCKNSSRHITNELLDIYTSQKNASISKDSEKSNRKLIQSRKLEYHRKEAETSEVIVNKPGTFIGIAQNSITIKENGKLLLRRQLANLSHIVILGKGVSFSSNLLDYCMVNNIPIDIFDSHGKHIGSFLSTKFMELSYWQPQSLCSNEQRLSLAATLVAGKLRNQLNLVKYFHKYHKKKDETLNEKMEALLTLKKEFDLYRKNLTYKEDNLLCKIVGYESQGAIRYWDFIRQLVSDDKVNFGNREHKGAKDIFNNMLNYGYSLLYARVWQALLAAKLNPFHGLIHTQASGKPSLVFDFVELFRAQAVDRIVVSLVQKHLSLGIDSNGFLTEETRALLAKNVIARFERYENYRGEEMKFEKIISVQAKCLAEALVSNKPFKPYVAKW